MKVPKRFFIIDDDQISQSICELSIKKFWKDIPVYSFENGKDALASLNESSASNAFPPETVVFVNINMPGMSGWEFLDEFSLLHENFKQAFRFCILSSSLSSEDIQKSVSHPLVQRFIEKPLSTLRIMEIFDLKPSA